MIIVILTAHYFPLISTFHFQWQWLYEDQPIYCLNACFVYCSLNFIYIFKLVQTIKIYKLKNSLLKWCKILFLFFKAYLLAVSRSFEIKKNVLEFRTSLKNVDCLCSVTSTQIPIIFSVICCLSNIFMFFKITVIYFKRYYL